jgi:hypothetical protein
MITTRWRKFSLDLVENCWNIFEKEVAGSGFSNPRETK